MNILKFLRGGLNTDDSVETMDAEDWSEAVNIIDGRSSSSKNGEKEGLRGTISVALPADIDGGVPIGVLRYGKQVSFVFIYNSTASKNCIIKIENGVASLVLKWSGLNFSLDSRINGGGLAGNLLYFTDGYNAPRCVHITRYAGGSTPTNEQEILHIRRGPQYPPEVAGLTGIFSTGVKPVDDVQFAYQYEYEDGQLSVISPWSALIPSREDLGYTSEAWVKIGLSETYPQLISKIHWIARQGNTGTPFYWKESLVPVDPTVYQIFTDQKISVMDSAYEKQFEPVPLTVGTACISKSRIWFGDYVEGYDTPTSGVTATTTVEANPSILSVGRTLSSNSRFKLGVVFHDSQGRSCGVMDLSTILITGATTHTTGNRRQLRYRIAGTAPAWAVTFSPVITKDLNKSYFVGSWGIHNTGGYIYITDTTDTTGSLTYNSSTTKYIRLSIASQSRLGLEYSYTAGDLVYVTNSTTGSTYGPLKVVGTQAGYVLCEAQSMGDVAFQYSFQIFSPSAQTDALYYEIGQRRAVGVGQALDTTDYYWYGDCQSISTSIYYVQQMRQKAADSGGAWNTDHGKPYIATPIGQVTKRNYFKHSAPFISGTNVNGLSEFDSGDESSVAIESIAIQKLQPTAKEATEGDVILAICNNDTYSIYVNEARMSTGEGSSFLVKSTDVIGDVRKQRTGFGTIHPESIFEEDGYVYGYCHINRAFWRYATNGIFPISEYKAYRHFEEQAALNDEDSLVITGYDPYYKAIFVTFENASSTVKKTIVFSLTKERWISYINFAPDLYLCDTNRMLSIREGALYSHDSDSYNGFYSTIYDSYIKCPIVGGDVPQEWRAVAVRGSSNFFEWSDAIQQVVADAMRVDISNKYGQETNVLYDEFDVNENIAYADIRGDLNTGTVLSGDPIYSEAIECKVTFAGGSYKQLGSIKVGFEPSRGHNL